MNQKLYSIKKRLYKLLGQQERLMELNLRYYKHKGVRFGGNMRAFSPLISAEPYLLEFGDNVTVSTDVTFITHDNSVSKVVPNSTDTFGKIKVGNNCFIGHRSILLPGVELGDSVIVGAGSVVTKSFIQGNVVIGGNPARIICSTKDYESKIKKFTISTKGLSYDQKKKKLLSLSKDQYLKK